MAGPLDALEEIAAAVKSMARLDQVPQAVLAVVASADPVTVIIEGDASLEPRRVAANFAGPLTVGQRVRLERVGKRMVVVQAPGSSGAKALVYWSGSQSIAGGVTTTLAVSDSSLGYDTTISTASPAGLMRVGDTLVAPVAGWYQADMRVVMTGNSSGNRLIEIRQGSTVVASMRPGSPSTAQIHMTVMSPPLQCAAGDVFTARVLQSAGASLTVVAGHFALFST